MEDHDRRKKFVCNCALGRAGLGADLVPSLHPVLGLAEHDAFVRRQRSRRLPGAVVPAIFDGLQPGTPCAACRSFVEPGCRVANRDRPPFGWRHGIHVGCALPSVDSAAFMFSHRPTLCAAVGVANSRVRSPGLGSADGDYWGIACLFAIFVAAAQHELCVSGSVAAPNVGAGTGALDRDSGRVRGDFFLAYTLRFLANLSSGPSCGIKERLNKGN